MFFRKSKSELVSKMAATILLAKLVKCGIKHFLYAIGIYLAAYSERRRPNESTPKNGGASLPLLGRAAMAFVDISKLILLREIALETSLYNGGSPGIIGTLEIRVIRFCYGKSEYI